MSWQDVIDDFDETYKKKDTPQLNQTTWEGFECLIKIYQSEPNRYQVNSEHISNNAEKLFC